ncbi:MAG: hydroxyisourate hydrolase [Pseudorhodobacter sp.]
MNKAGLTTHVLDTALGRPAAGMRIRLYRLVGEERSLLEEQITNADGRTNQPMLDAAAMAAGVYELIFSAGDYLRQSGAVSGDILFLDEIPIRFGLTDAAAHYHVPLLISPFAYSTYRGS